MAPPKRANPRRVGSQEPRQVTPAAPATSGQASTGASEDPDGSTSSRPQVSTRQSYSYGTSKTPVMPLPLETNPGTTQDQIAETIDAGLRQARERERELQNSRHRVLVNRTEPIRTRSQTRRSQSIEASPAPPPARSRSRQITPDEQLMDSLRESTEGSRSTSREESTPDSAISWRVERAIHGKPQRNQFPVETTRGLATLSAKPRRPIKKASGLRDMIKEEPVESEEIDMSSIPVSEEPSTNNTGVGAIQMPTTRGSSVEAIEADVSPTVESAASAEPTRYSTSNTSDTSPTIPIAPTLIRQFNFSPLSMLTFLLAIVAMFGTYTFSDKLIEIPRAMTSPIFGCINQSHVGYNASDLTGHSNAINHLSSQLDKLSGKFRDMSNDINDLKDDWSKKLPLINEVISRAPPPPPSQPPRNPLSPPRVNFCSIGLGAVIDPYLTSPTKTKTYSFLQRVHLYALGVRQGPSPATALQPWDGVGDCWCSSGKTGTTHIAIHLGRKIVPEEVVIEHIPKGATLNPEAAPRDMELWVEYKTDVSTDETSNPPFPLHETIMGTLREAYPDEPETAYSDDLLLGPNFYRVGKWEYDIDADNHIQAFPLNAVIDMPGARVEKVVFRTNSNWGSDYTCFYRLRLHGFL